MALVVGVILFQQGYLDYTSGNPKAFLKLLYRGRRDQTYADQKMGYHDAYELGPAEVVEITADGWKTLMAPRDELKVCAFLWTYYGYPNSSYEGINVETMRYRNGEILARQDKEKGVAQDIDMVSGVPDSGTPHAIGYANESKVPFGRRTLFLHSSFFT